MTPTPLNSNVGRAASVVPISPEPDAMLGVALEALQFEHAHSEATRSRAAGLLTACGVLLALTAGLGLTAAQAAQKVSHSGPAVAVCAAALTALLLLGAAVLSGMVFSPSPQTRTPVQELRELAELRFRVVDQELVSNAARERLAAVRAVNLVSRKRIRAAMAFYIGALVVLGSQVLLIAIVHLLGV
jgi:hypothetical protein